MRPSRPVLRWRAPLLTLLGLTLLLACAAVLLFMRGAGYSYGGYWFACCNLLVGGSNLLPLPGLDGWHIAGALHGIWRT